MECLSPEFPGLLRLFSSASHTNPYSQPIFAINKKSHEGQIRYEGSGTVHIMCKDWEEFGELSRNADTLSFTLDDELNLYNEFMNAIQSDLASLENAMGIKVEP